MQMNHKTISYPFVGMFLPLLHLVLNLMILQILILVPVQYHRTVLLLKAVVDSDRPGQGRALPRRRGRFLLMLVNDLLHPGIIKTAATRVATLGQPSAYRGVLHAHQIVLQLLVAAATTGALVARDTSGRLEIVDFLHLVLVRGARDAAVLLVLAVVPVVLIDVVVVVVVLGGNVLAAVATAGPHVLPVHVLAVLAGDDVVVVVTRRAADVVAVLEEQVVPALLGALQAVVVLFRGELRPGWAAAAAAYTTRMGLRRLPSHSPQVL